MFLRNDFHMILHCFFDASQEYKIIIHIYRSNVCVWLLTRLLNAFFVFTRGSKNTGKHFLTSSIIRLGI